MAGARPALMTRSSIAGFIASTTTSTSFLGSAVMALPEDSQARVLLLAAPAAGDQQPQEQRKDDDPHRRQQHGERSGDHGRPLGDERQRGGRFGVESRPHA